MSFVREKPPLPERKYHVCAGGGWFLPSYIKFEILKKQESIVRIYAGHTSAKVDTALPVIAIFPFSPLQTSPTL